MRSYQVSTVWAVSPITGVIIRRGESRERSHVRTEAEIGLMQL